MTTAKTQAGPATTGPAPTAETLRGLLTLTGITQAELADQCLVSTRTIRNWASGTTPINPLAMSRLRTAAHHTWMAAADLRTHADGDVIYTYPTIGELKAAYPDLPPWATLAWWSHVIALALAQDPYLTVLPSPQTEVVRVEAECDYDEDDDPQIGVTAQLTITDAQGQDEMYSSFVPWFPEGPTLGRRLTAAAARCGVTIDSDWSATPLGYAATGTRRSAR